MLRGVVGLIKWSYYTAAAINGYEVTRNKAGTVWSLTGNVVNADAFKMAQRPLVFVAKHAKGAWTFPIESFVVNQDTQQMTATLKPPLE